MSSPECPETPVVVRTEWCKACGICIAMCPKKVLEAGPGGKAVVARPEDCIKCEMCEIMCPDLAVRVVASRSRGPAQGKGEAVGAR
ncbi:MAG: 4Fe-4S binding protein [Clostridia bacterium]|nr:4Fe-4S binding protein [Clostridia bacterium]